jgi:hypothetical protein
MKLVIIGLLNMFLIIQAYAAPGPTEIKASEIIETLKSSNQLNGKALSIALKPYVKDASTLKGISTLDTSKTSEADLKKMVVTFITLAENQKAGMCLKEEAMCGGQSDLSCCSGLKCSNVTVPQKKMCKANGDLCTDSSSCCSGSCETNGKIKSCSPVRKCLRVLKEGENCLPYQSICELGFCGRVNTNTTNLNLCARNREACKSNSECCSKKCDNNVCLENFQCQNCKSAGEKVKGSEKCCEGYYPDLDGTCISDYPPSGPVTVLPKKKILQHIIDFLIPSAQAEIPETIFNNPHADFKTCHYDSKKSYYNALTPASEAPSSRQRAVDWSRAFEFMASGDGVNDYWKKNGKSIFDRAKVAAEEIKTNRLKSEATLAELDDYMTCTCLSMKWVDDPLITEAKKTFFKTIPCAGMTMKTTQTIAAQNDPGAADLDSGTSSLKYTEMLSEYFTKSSQINAQLNVQNSNSFLKLKELSNYLNSIVWTGKETVQVSSSHSRDRNWIQLLVDIFESIIRDLFHIIIYQIQQLINNQPDDFWKGTVALWQQNPNTGECHETGSTWYYWGISYHISCLKQEFAPNPICGKKIFNALCIRVAAVRSDSGPLSANKYLIDPLLPKSMPFTLDSGFIDNFDQNVNMINVGYVRPQFSEAKKIELMALAKQYAIDQDFYDNDSRRDLFAKDVFENHFIYPYSSTTVVYPAPELLHYYDQGTQHLDTISTTYAEASGKDLERAIKYGNFYLTTLDQYKDYRAAVSPGKVSKIRNTVSYAKFALGSMRNLTGGNSPDASKSNFNDSFFSRADAFDGAGDAQLASAKYKKNQQDKLDNWNKHVGGTAKGKKLLEMRDLRNAGNSGNLGGASSGSGSGHGASSNSGSGNFKKSFLDSEASDLGKAATTTAGADSGAQATAGSGAGNNGAGMTSIYGNTSGSGDSAGTGSGASTDATGLSAEEQQAMLDSANRDKNKLKPNEYDSLFGIIHKAYGRNLIHLFGSKKEIE